MAKLIVTNNGDTLGEYPIGKECLTIGRKADNDIVLDHAAISGHHAQIITLLNESFVEDLDSTNGTFVNGKLIRKHALRDGDIITLGEHRITYVNELARPAGEDFERTTVLGRSATKAKEPKAPPATIRILTGGNKGREMRLTKSVTTLGKPNAAVAAISRKARGYFIIGVEGAGDPQRMSLNGETIGTQALPLDDNDIIEIAGVKMQFNLG
jgi:hypothetical protein